MSATSDYDTLGAELQNRDPESISRDIETTRQEVDETLDALEAKLSPGQIADRMAYYVRENGGEFAANLGNSVKRNPLAMVLTGVGLAWMMVSQRSASPPSDSAEGARNMVRRAREKAGSVGEKARDAGRAVSDAASTAADRLSEMADSASNTFSTVTDGVAGASAAMTSQARRARAGLSEIVEEQPLLLGAVGLAAGALLGSLLPDTDTEDRLFGDARDRTIDRAKEIGSEQYSKARNAAAEFAAEGKSGTPPRSC